MAVAVFGGIVLDYISRVNTMEQDANLIEDFSQSLGGMGYNTAHACAEMGASTELVTTVGSDFPKPGDVPNLKLTLQRGKEDSTSKCFLFHGKEGERLYFYRGAYNDLDPKACEESIKRAQIVHFAGIMPTFEDIMEAAMGLKKSICFNPGYDINHYDPGSDMVRGMMAYSDYIILNKREFGMLKTPAEELAKGKKALIITKGVEGSDIYTDGKMVQVNAYRVKSESPFGAGDTYSGSFLAAVSKGKTPQEATKIASAAASFAVEQRSTAPELSWKKVLERAKKL